MKNLGLLFLMIFPFVWIGITLWAMVKQKTEHWLYRGWLWLHWFVLSFIFIVIMTSPLMVAFFGFLIPFLIFGVSKILELLGALVVKFYTIYNIIVAVVSVTITFLIEQDIKNYEPGFLALVMITTYLLVSCVIVRKIFNEKSLKLNMRK